MWAGTINEGLNRYDPKTGQFTRYLSKNDKRTLPYQSNISDIYEDHSHHIWIGTVGTGLLKYEGDAAPFRSYLSGSGAPGDNVWGIGEDLQGYLWICTNTGLSRITPDTGESKNFDILDGIPGNDFDRGDIWMCRDGMMVLGGLNGLTTFYPEDIVNNPHVPPVVITQFLLFNKPVPVGEGSPLSRHISQSSTLKLTYHQNSIAFEFTALNYTCPARNQYAYMLEGFDRDWHHTPATNRHAVYTNLDDGVYTFRVKASNNDGLWNDTGTSIKITITPPFWQTWWFRLFVFFAVSAVVFLLSRRRERHVRMKTKLQTAHDAQMSIMPQQSPGFEGFDIHGACRPANHVGGDFFDYILLEGHDHRFYIAVGDVSGKAMYSAMTAVMVAGMVHSKAVETVSVSAILNHVNHMAYRKTKKSVFTALCLSGFETRQLELVFTNAGLPEPLLKRETSVSVLKGTGSRLPLGAIRQTVYGEQVVKLQKGDIVVFYTDGVSEARNREGRDYDTAGLIHLLKNIDTASLSARGEIVDAVVHNVIRFSAGTPQLDDITVVAVKL